MHGGTRSSAGPCISSPPLRPQYPHYAPQLFVYTRSLSETDFIAFRMESCRFVELATFTRLTPPSPYSTRHRTQQMNTQRDQSELGTLSDHERCPCRTARACGPGMATGRQLAQQQYVPCSLHVSVCIVNMFHKAVSNA